MVLADEAHEVDILHSDSNSLATLLLFRDLFNVQWTDTSNAMRRDSFLPKPNIPMICEILDPRTQKTIQSNVLVQRASDFVQSNQLISQIFAMISEDRNVKQILNELLGPKGADLGVKTVARYMGPRENLSFMQLAARCQKLDEILVGYQKPGGKDEKAIVTVMNPRDKHVKKSVATFWSGTELVRAAQRTRCGEHGTDAILCLSQVVISKTKAQSSNTDTQVKKKTTGQQIDLDLEADKAEQAQNFGQLEEKMSKIEYNLQLLGSTLDCLVAS
jgi:hypothetical protein